MFIERGATIALAACASDEGVWSEPRAMAIA
jgi:hypothetical protein